MAAKALRVAVVGASTLLGKEVVEELVQSGPPTWNITLLEEGEEAEGQLTAAGDEPLVTHALNEEAMTGMDLVLFAGDPTLTNTYVAATVKAGAGVVDLSGATEGREGFVLRSPWVESSQRPDLTTAGVTLPHPAAVMLGLVGSRLSSSFGRTEVIATVLEPASQAGAAGVDELHQQTVGLLSFQEVPKQVFDTQIAFTLQAALGEEARSSLAKTRSRILNDLTALFGNRQEALVSLQLLQAPVFHGYVVTAHVKLAAGASVEALRSALNGGVIVAAEDTQPSNQAATESGDLLISVEADSAEGTSFWLVLAADNLRLAARNALSAAQELAALRPGTRVQ